MANFSQSIAVTNLATHTVTIPTTDVYSFQGTLTLPKIDPSVVPGPGGGAGTGSGGGLTVPSQVVVTIKQNGTTMYTGQSGAGGFALNGLSCTAGDVITIIRSSSLAQDQQPEAIKMTIAISEGPL